MNVLFGKCFTQIYRALHSKGYSYRLLYLMRLQVKCQYFKNECECFIGVSNTRKLMKARGRRPSAFIVFKCLKPRWNTKHEFLKLLLQQKKISLNYHLNKVSQFNYYIWDVKCAWCAWSYHLTAALWQFLNTHQLMSHCYLAVCQFWANTLLRKANGGVHI